MHTTATPDPIYYRHPAYGQGRSAEASRNYRANYAAGSIVRRAEAYPCITTRDATGRLLSDQPVTPYAIDGIHPCAPQHRMFGPAEAHDARAMERDALRREFTFYRAEDHGSRELDRTYRRAGIAQWHRAARFNATAAAEALAR